MLEKLEELAKLKEKGIITEEEFKAKRDEYFNASIEQNRGLNKIFSMDIKSKIGIGLLVVFIILGVKYITSKPADVSLAQVFLSAFQEGAKSEENAKAEENQVGKNGFTIFLSCKFYSNELVLQACTRTSSAVLTSGTNRRSYDGYFMPSTYTVPQHFDFYLYNGSDKFTMEMEVIDNDTRKVIARRQVGPYDSDRVRN